MSIDPFGGLYNSRPRIVFNSSLRNSGTAIELAEIALSKGYIVEFGNGSFRHDLKMHEGWDSKGPLKDHSLRSAASYLSDHPGVD